MNIAYIEDHAVPQLFTTAIEAYEFTHQATSRSRAYDKLETFGLLWGYSIPAKGSIPGKIIAAMATAETSAIRHSDWVKPNFDSIKAKKEFFEKYWPHLELVGTFHSHPYDDLTQVNSHSGWRASDGDERFWPTFHKLVSPAQPALLHLVIAITSLGKRGWAWPSRLSKSSEQKKGYIITAEYRKLWLRAYATYLVDDNFTFADDMDLEIPALEKRFAQI